MAAFVYHDYITLDGSARLTRLRLHIQEVSAALANADVSAHGYSATRATQQQYLKDLKDEEMSLAAAVGRGASGGVTFVRRG